MSVEEIKSLIEKANKFIASSELLLNSEDYDSAVSRTYYSMFFATEALLLTKRLAPKSHSGLINLFGDHFIKQDIFPKEMGRQLNRAFDKRLIGDYGTALTSDKKEAKNIVKIGKEFVEKIIKYLKENTYFY